MTDNVVPFHGRKASKRREPAQPGRTAAEVANNFAPTRLQSARELRGVGRRDLSEQIGEAPTAVIHWETGITKPVAYQLERLAQVLEVPVTYFAAGRPEIRLDSSDVFICSIDR